jgi:cysteine desulfurase
MSTRIYLDCNATHPILEQAKIAAIEAFEIFGNPSSVHREGRVARALVDKARINVAKLVNAKCEYVIFTSGATESANTVLTPVWKMGQEKLPMSKLYVGATEHPSMVEGGRFLREDIVVLPVFKSGELDLTQLENALKNHDTTRGTALIAVQHANSETGVIQPIHKIASVVKQYGGVFIVDATQTFGKIPLDISTNCGDFFIVSSHKIGGIKGAGAIIGVTDLMMPTPLFTGGGQEKSHRAGTPSVPAIASFGAAAFLCRERIARSDDLIKMRDRIETIILTVDKTAIIHGKTAAERMPNTVYFSLSNLKAETLQIAFDLNGIALSSGSACSSGKVGSSSVLKAMNFESDRGALRLSFCLETSQNDIAIFETTLNNIIKNSLHSKL